MPIRSMTGFAQAKGEANIDASGWLSFTVSLKSVNHRFLDLHLRVPPETETLEMNLRRLLKQKLARGHVELALAIERGGQETFSVNKNVVGGFLQAFRRVAEEFGISAEPDLNTILKMPGALSGVAAVIDGNFEAAVIAKVEEAIARLDETRTEEGRSIERELRQRMARLKEVTAEVEKHRAGILRAHVEKLQSRMKELVGAHTDPDRILQEAALLAERSDIQEEVVRMNTHIQHFLGVLDEGAEAGKRLDFLLQEMNREANTLLSKTSGAAGEALRITELGLAMKSEIEKSREQVQNIE